MDKPSERKDNEVTEALDLVYGDIDSSVEEEIALLQISSDTQDE